MNFYQSIRGPQNGYWQSYAARQYPLRMLCMPALEIQINFTNTFQLCVSDHTGEFIRMRSCAFVFTVNIVNDNKKFKNKNWVNTIKD